MERFWSFKRGSFARYDFRQLIDTRIFESFRKSKLQIICDIDKTYLDRASQQFPAARTYADYREMLVAEQGKIDAVVVGTTDHHHAEYLALWFVCHLHQYELFQHLPTQ